MTTWHLLTPELPPDCGGVGDYTALLAAGLAASGDLVHIWHPDPDAAMPRAAAIGFTAGVTVHGLPDRFGPASRAAIESALSSAPGVLLTQYVPGAFGARGMNVLFCRWLARLRRHGIDVRVMFHEPFFYFGLSRPWRNVLAVVQRAMAAILLRASTRVYYSTETWLRLLAPYGPQTGVEVLPIPSTIPLDVPVAAVAAARALRHGEFVIGHFGSYGDHIVRQLRALLPPLLARLPAARMLLVGDGGESFARALPAGIRDRVAATGRLTPVDAAAALRACDLLVQPYPDGVTTRRTSMMAALTTAVPVVTTVGPLTEPLWAQESAVALAPVDDVAALVDVAAGLADDAGARAALGARGRKVYDSRFALDVTIGRLRR